MVKYISRWSFIPILSYINLNTTIKIRYGGRNLISAIILFFLSANYFLLVPEQLEEIINKNKNEITEIILIPSVEKDYQINFQSLNQKKENLYKKGIMLNKKVINKVVIALKCAAQYNIEHNNILTIIDYSLPSNKKRLWVFDLVKNKLLFYTYVSHGIKSGTLLSKYFSNRVNSKTSSIGVYSTGKAYYGRHGISLKLIGLDKDFNDNAYRRFVVMHGAWYVGENFIKRYGRAGRSWGCPAVPLNLVEPIINTIKDNSLFLVYYPSNNWFIKSKFLNCNNISPVKSIKNLEIKSSMKVNEIRDRILFADINNNNKRDENEPILVMTAGNYQNFFNAKPPLTRMLRRQINNKEYIALTNSELKDMDVNNDNIIDNYENLNSIFFVVPVVKMQRGYYATEMKIVFLGKVKEIRFNMNSSKKNKKESIIFEKRSPINIRSTNQFIRWLGL